MSPDVRILTHLVQKCPLCAGQHTITIRVRPKTAGPLLFGGNSAVTAEAYCPSEKQKFTIAPHLDDSEEIVEVEGVPSTGAQQEQADSEYAEWIKTSRSVALDYCKTMLTSAAGAVAIYFAVLKYLGAEKVADGPLGVVSVVPALLFLAAVAAFALALRPRLGAADQASFAAFRNARLQQLNRLQTTGTVLFVIGLAVSVLLFAYALLPA